MGKNLKLSGSLGQKLFKVDYLDGDAPVVLEASPDDLISRYFAADESSIEEVANAYADARLDGASVYSYRVIEPLIEPSNAPAPLEYWAVTAAKVSPLNGVMSDCTYAYALTEEQAHDLAHALQRQMSDGTDSVAVWIRYDEVL